MTSAQSSSDAVTIERELPKLLTAAEVAQVLRTSPYQVSLMCKTGRLPATKPGRTWLVAENDLHDFLAASSNAAQVAQAAS